MNNNVFISYRRVEPDQSLAKFLVEKLEANGQSVFWDKRITIGQDWARVIDERMQKAKFFVVLVSTESMRSDMVREEIKLAHALSRRAEDPLKILPIRVAYIGDLPYDLRAYSMRSNMPSGIAKVIRRASHNRSWMLSVCPASCRSPVTPWLRARAQNNSSKRRNKRVRPC